MFARLFSRSQTRYFLLSESRYIVRVSEIIHSTCHQILIQRHSCFWNPFHISRLFSAFFILQSSNSFNLCVWHHFLCIAFTSIKTVNVSLTMNSRPSRFCMRTMQCLSCHLPSSPPRILLYKVHIRLLCSLSTFMNRVYVFQLFSCGERLTTSVLPEIVTGLIKQCKIKICTPGKL